MALIGRKNEVQKINKELAKDGFSLMVIFGRRRIGKSFLVKETLLSQPDPFLYYQAVDIPEKGFLQSISQEWASVFKEYLPPFATAKDFLDFLFQASLKKEIILVLDEVPLLLKNIPSFPSLLQALIDRYRGQSHLKLILLGSYVRVMRSLLSEDAPLYGRSDLILPLTGMDYYDSSLFYPSFSTTDKLAFYSLFGGVPYYNSLVDPSLSLLDNMKALFLEKDAKVDTETRFYLEGEISKIAYAQAVLGVLSLGAERFNSLWSKSGIDNAVSLNEVLKALLEIGAIRKIAPIDEPKNRKKTFYVIAENPLAFYYRYLIRYASSREIMSVDSFFQSRVQEDFEKEYLPSVFEEVASEFLIRENIAGAFHPVLLNIGKYWYDDPLQHKNGEFDVVSEDEKGFIFYEAKYWREPLGESVIAKEISQAKQTPLKPERFGFFAKSGYQGVTPRPSLRLWTLEDLYR